MQVAAVGTGEHSLALCLSGGGLRATLFHLGVIKALRRYEHGGRTALESVTTIFSVSGGSIVAGHLIREWESYRGADEAKFEEVEAKLLAFARRNIRDRVVRRWLLNRWRGKRRSDWLIGEYAELLGHGSLAECYADPDRRPPKIHVLSTSFRTGELCSFSDDRFEIVRRSPQGTKTVHVDAGHLPLALAVAASSAFPPLFPPIPLTNAMLGGSQDPEFAGTIHLSDGGVFDNLGLERACLPSDSRGRRTLLVSNAGASFRTDPNNGFVSVLARNIRASDIMMRRAGDSTEDAASRLEGVDYVSLRIGDPAEAAPIKPEMRTRLRAVRTDLDRFDATLSSMLVDHGEEVASAALEAGGWIAKAPRRPLTVGRDQGELDRVAERATKRRYWSIALDFRDWTTTPLLWALGLAILVGGGLGGMSAWDERQAREEARKAVQYNTALAKLIAPMQVAYAKGDTRTLEKLLGVAVRTAEASEQAPERDIVRVPVRLSAEQASAAATERPAIDVPRLAGRRIQPVYIQFAGVLTRTQITELNQGLKRAGWNPQGTSGERTGRAAGVNEVRFAGGNEAAARDLASAINAAGLVRQEVRPRQLEVVGPQNLEVWISE